MTSFCRPKLPGFYISLSCSTLEMPQVSLASAASALDSQVDDHCTRHCLARSQRFLRLPQPRALRSCSILLYLQCLSRSFLACGIERVFSLVRFAWARTLTARRVRDSRQDNATEGARALKLRGMLLSVVRCVACVLRNRIMVDTGAIMGVRGCEQVRSSE